MKIEIVDIGSIKPYDKNPRRISKKNLQRLERSISEFGMPQPIICNKDGTVIGGHQRLKAARNIGMDKVPVIYMDLPEDKMIALNIALNNPNMQGEWEEPELVDLLSSLLQIPDTDPTSTGFDLAEIETLIGRNAPEPKDQENYIPEIPEVPLTKPGDAWQLGDHQIKCADMKTLPYNNITLCVTSPPYWVGKDYETQQSTSEVRQFIYDASESICKSMNPDNSRICINTGTGNRRAIEGTNAPVEQLLLLDWWIDGFRRMEWLMRHCRLWDKPGRLAAGGGVSISPKTDIIAPSWEFIATFYNPSGSNRGQERLGPDSLSWAQQGVWKFSGSASVETHSATYPVELPKRLILLYTKPGETVLDPFLGSGTTLIAAHILKRKCIGIEMEPKYVDVAVKRWEEYTGKQGTRL